MKQKSTCDLIYDCDELSWDEREQFLDTFEDIYNLPEVTS